MSNTTNPFANEPAADHVRLYTFVLRSGRAVTYCGATYAWAAISARAYHGSEVIGIRGYAVRCDCAEKHAEPVRQGGFLICRDCAGYIG